MLKKRGSHFADESYWVITLSTNTKRSGLGGALHLPTCPRELQVTNSACLVCWPNPVDGHRWERKMSLFQFQKASRLSKFTTVFNQHLTLFWTYINITQSIFYTTLPSSIFHSKSLHIYEKWLHLLTQELQWLAKKKKKKNQTQTQSLLHHLPSSKSKWPS